MMRLPGLDKQTAGTLRASGEAVAGIQRAGDDNEWTLTLRKRVLGKFDAVIEYQQALDPAAPGMELAPLELVDAGSVARFVALRGLGRIAMEVDAGQSGWQRVDWHALPVGLADPAGGGPPGLVFRSQGGGRPLAVRLGRLDAAEVLDLRMVSAELNSVVSTSGASATVASFSILVNEPSAMRLRLPSGALFFGVTVQGVPQSAALDGDVIQFHVLPDADAPEPTVVEVAYLIPGGKVSGQGVRLEAPGPGIPVENVTWRIRLPEGWKLVRHSGALDLMSKVFASGWRGVDDYRLLSSSLKKSRELKTNELMAKADELLKRGEQSQARVALGMAAAQPNPDEAAGEDARIQLRNLANQQAVVGINTLRQKLLLENPNAADSHSAAQIKEAARVNPLLQGRFDFDLRQIDTLLAGNSGEETNALRRIADRIVSRQASVEAAPAAITPTLPEHGDQLVFSRNVQIDSSKPLALELKLARNEAVRPFTSGVLLLLLLVVAAASTGKRREENPR